MKMDEIQKDELTHSRFRGCLLGLASGDALGTSLEFRPPGSFTPILDMVGGGPFRLNPGEWTDDTSMALCLAESLIKSHGFNPIDQLERYVRWYQTGYLSSNGVCFDIGNTTSAALHRFLRTHGPYPGFDSPHSAGNGSLMRLAPVPMFYYRQPSIAWQMCADSSRTTHASTQAVDACRYYGLLLVAAVQGIPREALLSPPCTWTFFDKDLVTQILSLDPAILEVANGSFTQKQPPDIKGSGYVVRSMEAALWAFYHSTSFKEGALLAANLGDDADTTAAIYGQLAGAYYTEQGIPAAWRAKLALAELITRYADQIFELA
jgi:ADP-ribosyl-[dinitrogen reductase] hydrolase